MLFLSLSANSSLLSQKGQLFFSKSKSFLILSLSCTKDFVRDLSDRDWTVECLFLIEVLSVLKAVLRDFWSFLVTFEICLMLLGFAIGICPVTLLTSLLRLHYSPAKSGQLCVHSYRCGHRRLSR